MYVGSDRVASFTELLKKYESDNSLEPVNVVSVGKERKPSSTNLSGISGTLMRKAALRGDIEAFKKGTGFADANAAELMAEVRAGMGVVGGKRTRKMKRGRRGQARRSQTRRNACLK